ncbi:hypothetical protein CAPTEDRAFT_216735 [Capitella teleta]|uniref:G-protein coupled receptors family 1 profile domain-containing protein n=1 Tax=Capitella teleta TaxID=283909 RepID=R7U0D5_CAPTE|nr:hypothetical protein CAPTEDRAFT_216735 [Capitella teleta]|eukprot:ELT96670.1 hypothetical protein CAPTEDRAFT_216735 [Capitella teleta]
METTASLATDATLSPSAETPPFLPPWIGPVTLTVATLVSLIGVPGNATIVLIYSRKRRLNRVFILILATVDLIASSITVPSVPFIFNGLVQPWYETFCWGLSIGLITMSIWMLDCIALEYHRAICRPLTVKWSQNLNIAVIGSGAAWSFTLAILAWLNLPIMTPMTMWYVLISLAIMAGLYSHIVIFLMKRKKIGPTAPKSGGHLQSNAAASSTRISEECTRSVTTHSSSQIAPQEFASRAPPPGSKGTGTPSGKSARMLAMVTMFFALCFLPIYFCEFVLKIPPAHTLFLTFPNHAVNVIVYSIMNRNFRNDVMKLIRRGR